jgi:hypothetical protein
MRQHHNGAAALFLVMYLFTGWTSRAFFVNFSLFIKQLLSMVKAQRRCGV